MEIWETGNSDKGANVTICDLVMWLEGHDKWEDDKKEEEIEEEEFKTTDHQNYAT